MSTNNTTCELILTDILKEMTSPEFDLIYSMENIQRYLREKLSSMAVPETASSEFVSERNKFLTPPKRIDFPSSDIMAPDLLPMLYPSQPTLATSYPQLSPLPMVYPDQLPLLYPSMTLHQSVLSLDL